MNEVYRRPTLSRTHVCFALGFGLLLAWWNQCHENGYLFQPLLADQVLSCIFNSIGIIAACVALMVFAKRVTRPPSTQACAAVLFAVALVSGLAIEAFLWFEVDAPVPFLQLIASACVFSAILASLDGLGRMASHEAAFFIVLVLVTFSFAQFALFALTYVPFPSTEAELPQSIHDLLSQPWPSVCATFRPAYFARVFAHGAFLVASLALIVHGIASSNGTGPRATPHARLAPAKVRRTPLPLLVHLVSYPFVFGIIHALASGVVSNPLSKTWPEYLGVLLAAAVFYLAFAIDKNATLVWSKIRGVVFPVSMLAFISLPFAQYGDPWFSICLAEAAYVLYYALFLFACPIVAKRLNESTLRVAAVALSVNTCAFVIGTLIGDFMKFEFEPFGATLFSALTAVAFILLTAGTFWVGDDKTVSMLWGLEKKLPPKRFNAKRVESQCQSLAAERGLTARETNILIRIASGQTAAAIAEEDIISLNTVRTHIARIHRKLDVHSQAELLELVRKTEAR